MTEIGNDVIINYMKGRIKKISIIILILTIIITLLVFVYKILKFINNFLPDNINVDNEIESLESIEAVAIANEGMNTKEMITICAIGLILGFLLIQLLNFL